MSNYRDHAMTEFRAAGWIDDEGNFKDEMQEHLCNGVLALLEVFAGQGHSGFSAPYAIDLFKKMAGFEPLVPLTGEDWEWFDHGEGMFQNRRCSHVFKQAGRFNGQAYDINAVVFYDWYTDEETGEKFKSHFTNGDSHLPITFPYTPSTEYRERQPDA